MPLFGRGHDKAAAHDQNRLRNATDQAITAASRTAPVGQARVTIADVQRRACDDFGMHIDPAQARQVLADRLAFRGRQDIATDAND